MKQVPAIHVATLVAVSSAVLGAQSLHLRDEEVSTSDQWPKWGPKASQTKVGLFSHRATFVTYHKTGTVLVSGVIQKCFPSENFSFFGHGEPWNEHTRVVHHVRSPMSMIKSGYFYHKEANESWLQVKGDHRSWLRHDPECFAHFRENETYQQYLNRMPPTLGIRAEFLRSHKTVSKMLSNSYRCLASRRFCKQVCLEDFTVSSQSFNDTWSGIMEFLTFGKIQIAAHLRCISRFDLSSPNYNGAGTRHTTTDKAAVEEEMLDLADTFTNLDHELYNGNFAAASHILCPVKQQPYMPERAVAVDHYDEIAEMYG